MQQKEGLPFFRFKVTNVGTRPGKDALVVIRARGNFQICPPPYEEDGSEETEDTVLKVPSPPTPPRGRWRSSNTSLTSLERILQNWNALNRSPGLEYPTLPVAPFPSIRLRRDPNAFYYKPARITEPAEEFSLECEQWRHGTGSESFVGDIFVKEGVTKASGALECEVHAENLFKPAFRRIPVRIELKHASTGGIVEKLIDPPLDEVFRD